MIIEKILALLALLSTLTGCAGAEAASLPPAADGEPVPYVEAADPGAVQRTAEEESSDEPAPASTEDEENDAATEDESEETSPVFTEDEPEETSPVSEESEPEEYAPADTTSSETESGPAALYTLSASYIPGAPLHPQKGYGPLLPYVGGRDEDGLAMWGLVTVDGQVVTDPIYSYAKPFGPFFLLFRGGGDSGITPELTLCGGDGSWTMDAGDFHHSMLLDGLGLAAALKDGSVIIVSEKGRITQTFTRAQLEPYLGTGYSWSDEDEKELVYAGGPIAVCHWDEHSPYGNGASYDCFMNPSTGEITGEPPAGFAPENGWGEPDEEPYFPGYQYPDRVEDSVTGAVYYWGELNGRYNLLDSQGHVVLADFITPGHGLWEPVIGAGLLGTIRNGAFQFAEIDSGAVVFRYPLRG